MYKQRIARPPLTSLRLISGRPYGYRERNSVRAEPLWGGGESKQVHVRPTSHRSTENVGRTRLREGARSFDVYIVLVIAGEERSLEYTVFRKIGSSL